MATIVRATKDSVNHDLCIGCGFCVRSCPVKLYDLVDGKSVATRYEDCVGCGWSNATGRSIVCLPNGLEIRIVSGQSDVDFVVG